MRLPDLWLHQMEVGQEITIRGPYGNGFPVESAFKGQGPALYRRRHRPGASPLGHQLCPRSQKNYGKVDIVYGSSADDLVDYKEIIDEWMNEPDFNVWLTIDREQEGWDGHVGFVPNTSKELGFDTNKTVIICGPPIMIKFTLADLWSSASTKPGIHHHGT